MTLPLGEKHSQRILGARCTKKEQCTFIECLTIERKTLFVTKFTNQSICILHFIEDMQRFKIFCFFFASLRGHHCPRIVIRFPLSLFACLEILHVNWGYYDAYLFFAS